MSLSGRFTCRTTVEQTRHTVAGRRPEPRRHPVPPPADRLASAATLPSRGAAAGGARRPRLIHTRFPADLSLVADKELRLRWATTCSGCGADLAAGTAAWWNSAAKTATCSLCRSLAVSVEHDGIPLERAPIAKGIAGRSARRQNERLSARERSARLRASRLTQHGESRSPATIPSSGVSRAP